MQVERVLELANIAANKNTIPGDVSAMTPGGIRMGTPALTSRGFDEKDFDQVADFFHRAVEISKEIKAANTTMKAYREALQDGPEKFPKLVQLRKDVIDFARKFPTIGF